MSLGVLMPRRSTSFLDLLSIQQCSQDRGLYAIRRSDFYSLPLHKGIHLEKEPVTKARELGTKTSLVFPRNVMKNSKDGVLLAKSIKISYSPRTTSQKMRKIWTAMITLLSAVVTKAPTTKVRADDNDIDDLASANCCSADRDVN